jgi:hypothetical protein
MLAQMLERSSSKGEADKSADGTREASRGDSAPRKST